MARNFPVIDEAASGNDDGHAFRLRTAKKEERK
jgi:hypothetical protein